MTTDTFHTTYHFLSIVPWGMVGNVIVASLTIFLGFAAIRGINIGSLRATLHIASILVKVAGGLADWYFKKYPHLHSSKQTQLDEKLVSFYQKSLDDSNPKELDCLGSGL